MLLNSKDFQHLTQIKSAAFLAGNLRSNCHIPCRVRSYSRFFCCSKHCSVAIGAEAVSLEPQELNEHLLHLIKRETIFSNFFIAGTFLNLERIPFPRRFYGKKHAP